MDGIPRVVVSIPLYITLPRHPITRRKVSLSSTTPILRLIRLHRVHVKRYALVNAVVERMGRTRVRLKTHWTVVESPGPRQMNAELVVPTNPKVPGVTTFMPDNPLGSPLYMFVTELDGKCISVSV